MGGVGNAMGGFEKVRRRKSYRRVLEKKYGFVRLPEAYFFLGRLCKTYRAIHSVVEQPFTKKSLFLVFREKLPLWRQARFPEEMSRLFFPVFAKRRLDTNFTNFHEFRERWASVSW